MMGPVRGAADRPPYLSHFALREPPFSPAADDRFFYADPARQQCLNLLQHLAEYSEEWLLVSGDPGVGKTTLLNQFLARADAHVHPCRIDGAQAADGGRLFAQIAQSFGVDLSRAGGNPLEAVRQHLNALHAEQVPLAAVDNADRLSDDALEILLRLADLEGDHGKLVRVVLFGDRGLQQRLGAERFTGLSRPHVMELRPLDEGHTGLYLAHRLSIAGFEGRNPFDLKTVRQIHKESGGLPARINSSADAFLRQKMAIEKGKGGNWTRRVLVPVVALGAVGGIGFLLQEQMLGVFGPPLSANESQPQAPQAKARAIPLATPLAATTTAELVPLAERPLVLREGESIQVTCSPLEQKQGTGDASPIAPGATAPAGALTKPPEAESASAAPEKAPATPKSATAPVEIAATPAPAAKDTAVASQTAPAATNAPGSAPTTSVPVAAPAPTEVAPPATAAAKGAETPKPASAASARTGNPRLTGAAWLKAQNPDHFTLQLLAANHEATARAYVREWRVAEPHAVIETSRNGAPLHLLVSGSWATKQAAQSAAAKLPRGMQAWPRRFGELQAHPEAATPAANGKAPAMLKDAAWVRSRDPRHFAVQLVSAGQEQALWDHLGSESLPNPLAVVGTSEQGRPWHVLFYGDFVDRESALKAAAALPAKLRRGEPWLREYAAIQALPPPP